MTTCEVRGCENLTSVTRQCTHCDAPFAICLGCQDRRLADETQANTLCADCVARGLILACGPVGPVYDDIDSNGYYSNARRALEDGRDD